MFALRRARPYSAAMEIRVFLTNGCVHRYAQDDPQLIKQNLGRIDPQKFYAQETLAIGDEEQSTGFRTKDVLRVEFRMNPLPDWPFPPNIVSLRLLDEGEFRAKAQESVRQEQRWKVGETFVAYAEIEDCRGDRFFLEAAGKVLPDSVRARKLSRILEAPCLHIRRGEDTAILLNPACLSRVCAYTRDPSLPATALHARAIDPA